MQPCSSFVSASFNFIPPCPPAAKMATDIRALRKKIRDEELSVVEAQNELAKLQVCIVLFNCKGHALIRGI